MRHRVKRIQSVFLLLIVFLFMVTGCTKKPSETANNDPKAEDYAIQHEPEFSGVYIEITIDDFNKLGFRTIEA